MIEPTSIVLVGAGAWLADKVFSPATISIGDHLRAYLSTKTKRIVEAASRKADPNKAKDLAPGFLYNFLQKSSSDDSDEITDMWASLLADATESLSYRHSIFADILSQIGPSEAQVLEDIYPLGRSFPLVTDVPIDIRPSIFRSARDSVRWYDVISEAGANEAAENLLNTGFRWPVRVRKVDFTWTDDIENGKMFTVSKTRPFSDSFAIDALDRQRLIDYFEFDFSPGWSSPSMDGYYMTLLGVQFLDACRRPDRVAP